MERRRGNQAQARALTPKVRPVSPPPPRPAPYQLWPTRVSETYKVRVDLRDAGVERTAETVLLDQPLGVVAGGEVAHGVADLVDGLEDAAIHGGRVRFRLTKFYLYNIPYITFFIFIKKVYRQWRSESFQ